MLYFGVLGCFWFQISWYSCFRLLFICAKNVRIAFRALEILASDFVRNFEMSDPLLETSKVLFYGSKTLPEAWSDFSSARILLHKS